MSKESWSTTARQPCLLRRSFPQPAMGTGWEGCRTWAVPDSSADSRQSRLLIPFLPHSCQGSTSLWVQTEVLEAVCAAAGGWALLGGELRTGLLNSAERSRIAYMASITDILDILCWDCSQTSLVRPYPLAPAILRTSFSIVAVVLKD